jgi:hypothetical protein
MRSHRIASVGHPGLIIAAMLSTLSVATADPVGERIVPLERKRRTQPFPGSQEMARRRRQMGLRGRP